MITKDDNKTRNRPLPELLGREDTAGGEWQVDACSATRGTPVTSVARRKMAVPMSDDALSTVIRIHEMVHAKVSPTDLSPYIERGFASEGALRAVEEARVNYLAGRLGYDMGALIDGGETETGERMVAMGDWDSAVLFAVATLGTDGHKKFLNGVRRHNKVWGGVLADIGKRVMKELKRTSTYLLASTTPDDNGLIEGFLVTEGISSWVDRLCENVPDDKSDDDKSDDDKSDGSGDTPTDEATPKKRGRPKSSTDKGEIDEAIAKSRKTDSGGVSIIPAWFPLNVKRLPMPDVLTGAMGKKRVASNTGKHPRRIHRYLIDPHKRVFDRTIKGKGGVVVIDCSGSMSLSRDDVMNIVLASPGCTVLAYSVRSWGMNDEGEPDVPNAYVLADGGRIVDEMPSMGGGNGVDLPALKWAVSERRTSSTPIVWVCDGHVTGYHDQGHNVLTLQATEYCLSNRIAVVPNAMSAVKYLNELASGIKPKWSFPHAMREAYESMIGERLVA